MTKGCGLFLGKHGFLQTQSQSFGTIYGSSATQGKRMQLWESIVCLSIQQWRKRDKFFCSILPLVIVQSGTKEHAFEISSRGTENWGGVVLIYFSKVLMDILFSSEICNLKSSKYLMLLQPLATGQAAWNWCQL